MTVQCMVLGVRRLDYVTKTGARVTGWQLHVFPIPSEGIEQPMIFNIGDGAAPRPRDTVTLKVTGWRAWQGSVTFQGYPLEEQN